LDAILISPLVRENRKWTMSQFMPSFKNILPNSSSKDSHIQGAPSSVSTQVSRATGSSVDLTTAQVTVNIDTEDTTSSNSSSTSTSTSISGSSTGNTSESNK
jgi:hypothetical protein